jgi:prepilin-type N-terminal cleavage/methylation domain-containing protein
MTRRGFSLLEVTVVMTIAGIVVALAVPRLADLRDAASVRGAMGELGALYSAARHEAIARRGPVTVGVDAARGEVELRAGGVRLLRRSLAAIYGVSIGTNRDSSVYDARGIGFGLANVTIIVRRGAIVDTLTMSRLGRVRW